MPGRVLIVDDVPTNRMILKARLAQAYYDVIEAEDGLEALELAAEEQPDIVLLDVMMPGIDGFETCQRLKADARTAHVPVVMLTALDKREDKVQGLQAGADDFLTKPFEDVALLSRVSALIRTKRMLDEIALRARTVANADYSSLLIANQAAFFEARVLVVSTNPVDAREIAEMIRTELECTVDIAASAEEASDMAEFLEIDAMIIDHALDGADPLRLGTAIHARPETRHAAIVMIMPDGTIDQATKALDLGFTDYITAPIDMIELTARVRSALRRKRFGDLLRETVHTTMAEALTDPLTGTYNRRYASSHLDALIDRCRDCGSSLVLMMLDLDRFKSVNDTRGHQAGDEVLRSFAKRLQANVRVMDLVARVGGEEFMVVMPDVEVEAARDIAERVRAAVSEPGFEIEGQDLPLNLTVSIGLAEMQASETVFELIRRADEALYHSKNTGRNRVTRAA